jgi:hypothetical protein
MDIRLREGNAREKKGKEQCLLQGLWEWEWEWEWECLP